MSNHRMILFACALALLCGSVVTARAQAPAPAPVPEAMPFDIPYGTPITLEQAHKVIAAATAEATKHKWKMTIAVVGPAGQLIALDTMDGTQYASPDIAQAKARISALFRRQTKVFADAINHGTPASLTLVAVEHGAATEGGIPIVVDGKLIGAVGAAGGIASQDGVTAMAGAEALTPH